MLRADNSVTLLKMPWTPEGTIFGRYAVQAGKRVFPERWKKREFDARRAAQKDSPVAMLLNGNRKLWYFHDRFYWDDQGNLRKEDVMALALQRERREQQELNTAHSLMRAHENGHPTRMPVPRDLRRAVFERDGGKCVECRSGFDLQYDHILPVSRGGATTVENLQLLCADCNRFKSDSL